jgi:hypothetical protein
MKMTDEEFEARVRAAEEAYEQEHPEYLLYKELAERDMAMEDPDHGRSKELEDQINIINGYPIREIKEEEEPPNKRQRRR